MMPASPTQPPSPWLRINLIAQIAFGLLAMTICLPSITDWTREFGAAQSQVQLTFSGFLVAYGGLQLVYGPLSDRYGRKPVVMVGLFLSLGGSVLAAMASTLPALTLARVLQGAGSAANMVVGRALVQDLFVGAERTRMMAMVGVTLGVCPPVATVIGGVVHVRLGWQYNFVLMAVLAAVLLFGAWRTLPSGRLAGMPPPRGWRELVAAYVVLTRQPAFVASVGVLSMTTAVFYAYLGGAPLVLAAHGVTPERMGFYLMTLPVAYIFGNMLTLRLARRRNDGFIVALGQAITFSGLLLTVVLAAMGHGGPLALSLPMLLLGFGNGLIIPPTLAATVGLVPALAGSAAAVAGLMQQLAGAVGGYAVGLLPRNGTLELASLMLVIGIGGLFFMLWWSRLGGPGSAAVAPTTSRETRTGVPPSS